MNILDNLILIIEYLAFGCLVIIIAGLFIALLFLFVMMIKHFLDVIERDKKK